MAVGSVEFEAFPIRDRSVPLSREAVTDLTRRIVNTLDDRRNVAVHCRQGIGSSALIVAGVLVAAGQDLRNALEDDRSGCAALRS